MSTTLTKRPHAQALADAEMFRALFPAECYVRWEFAGSLRRGKPEVGDVEHVVEPAFGMKAVGGGLFAQTELVNLLNFQLDALLHGGEITKHVYGATGFRWGERYRGCDFRGFNHEIFAADVSNWGAILLIRTGPAEFSQRVVTRLKDGGMYRQQEGRVVHVASGETVPVADERAYLNLAGMEWVPPERRA